ncbi:MAG: protein TolR [Desulfobacteraceae bacterium 4572_35.1]|nr:MAG: protein TolR [Desulfobacteraceae bacterium 4572_35.1]
MEVAPKQRRSSLSQINVTPFVDVMLVLLIIFMVTAPMMEKGVDVNLPEVSQAPNLDAAQESLIVSIDSRGRIAVGKERVADTDKLVAVLQQIMQQQSGKQVYLEADKVVTYERVVRVLAAIRRAGVTRLGMVALEPQR